MGSPKVESKELGFGQLHKVAEGHAEEEAEAKHTEEGDVKYTDTHPLPPMHVELLDAPV
jgi:hypothetical protein